MPPKQSDRKSENQYENLSSSTENPGGPDSQHGANSATDRDKQLDDRFARMEARLDARLDAKFDQLLAKLLPPNASPANPATPDDSDSPANRVVPKLAEPQKRNVIKPDYYSEANGNSEIDLDTASNVSAPSVKNTNIPVRRAQQSNDLLPEKWLCDINRHNKPNRNESNFSDCIIYIDYIISEMNAYVLTDEQRDQWWKLTLLYLPEDIVAEYPKGATTTADQKNLKEYLHEQRKRKLDTSTSSMEILRTRLNDDTYVRRIKDEVDKILKKADQHPWDTTVQLLQSLFPPSYDLRGEPVSGRINLAALNYNRNAHKTSIGNVKLAYIKIIDDAVAEQKELERVMSRNNYNTSGRNYSQRTESSTSGTQSSQTTALSRYKPQQPNKPLIKPVRATHDISRNESDMLDGYEYVEPDPETEQYALPNQGYSA